METITIKCEACKNRIVIENKTGVHLCSICECKNEHYVFPNDLTIEEISAQCGFCNTSYFIKIFKNEELFTPRQFRQQHALNNIFL